MSLDHALSAALVGVLPRLAGLQEPTPAPAPPTDAFTAKGKVLVDMICQGLHVPGLPQEEKAQLTSRLLAVLDRGIGRWEDEVTSAGVDEMA